MPSMRTNLPYLGVSSHQNLGLKYWMISSVFSTIFSAESSFRSPRVLATENSVQGGLATIISYVLGGIRQYSQSKMSTVRSAPYWAAKSKLTTWYPNSFHTVDTLPVPENKSNALGLGSSPGNVTHRHSRSKNACSCICLTFKQDSREPWTETSTLSPPAGYAHLDMASATKFSGPGMYWIVISNRDKI